MCRRVNLPFISWHGSDLYIEKTLMFGTLLSVALPRFIPVFWISFLTNFVFLTKPQISDNGTTMDNKMPAFSLLFLCKFPFIFELSRIKDNSE